MPTGVSNAERYSSENISFDFVSTDGAYTVDIDISEFDMDGDLSNDSIIVEIGITFVDANDSYDFYAVGVLSTDIDGDGNYTVHQKKSKIWPGDQSSFQAGTPVSANATFYGFVSADYQMNVSIYDLTEYDNEPVEVSEIITLEGSLSDSSYYITSELVPISEGTNECADTFEIELEIMSYNLTESEILNMTMQTWDETKVSNYHNITDSMTIYTNSETLNNLNSYTFRFIMSLNMSYFVNISIVQDSIEIFTVEFDIDETNVCVFESLVSTYSEPDENTDISQTTFETIAGNSSVELTTLQLGTLEFLQTLSITLVLIAAIRVLVRKQSRRK